MWASVGPAADQVVGLAFLHHLAALIDHAALQRDEPDAWLLAVLLGRDARLDVDGVADLDRPLELPLHRGERADRLPGHHPVEEALLDRQAEQAVGDALAEQRRLHVLGVGVEHVVVAAQAREDHEVGLGHGAAGRGVLLAELDILEVDDRLAAHGGLG